MIAVVNFLFLLFVHILLLGFLSLHTCKHQYMTVFVDLLHAVPLCHCDNMSIKLYIYIYIPLPFFHIFSLAPLNLPLAAFEKYLLVVSLQD